MASDDLHVLKQLETAFGPIAFQLFRSKLRMPKPKQNNTRNHHRSRSSSRTSNREEVMVQLHNTHDGQPRTTVSPSTENTNDNESEESEQTRKRKANRLSSKRFEERKRKQVYDLKYEEERLKAEHRELSEENQTLRQKIAEAIEETKTLLSQSSAGIRSQRIQVNPEDLLRARQGPPHQGYPQILNLNPMAGFDSLVARASSLFSGDQLSQRSSLDLTPNRLSTVGHQSGLPYQAHGLSIQDTYSASSTLRQNAPQDNQQGHLLARLQLLQQLDGNRVYQIDPLAVLRLSSNNGFQTTTGEKKIY